MANEDNKKETLDNISLTDLIKTGKAEEAPVEEKSPLQKMKEYKESHPGMIVNNDEITYDNEKKILKDSFDTERRESDFKGYMADMDRLIDAAQSVTIERPPQNEIETAAMIDQLDRIAIAKSKENNSEPEKVLKTRDGKVINLPDSEKNGTPLNVPNGYNDKFFKSKEETHADSDEITKESSDENDESIDSDAIERERADAEEHEKLVNILIDKTGFGNDRIDFTEEERQKLSTAKEIRVTEVENLDIDSFVFDAPEKTYVDTIESSDNPLGGTTTVPLVASRYRAKMRGLGYGQLGDILLSGNEPTFEQVYKRFSTIYNNIVETSIGKFESFEDFLKKTAFIDTNMLIYGLMVSTYPEIDSVTVTCGKCGKNFEQKYFVRDLMDLSAASTTYLKRLDELMSCPATDFEKFAEESPVRKRKYIVLPVSKYVAEIGLVSAYDYLYQVVSNITSEQFKDEHSDDVNGYLKINGIYLNMVRSISIPNPNKEKSLIKYSSYEDMLQILYRLPMEDQQILNGIINQYLENYGYKFSIKNDVCPHCGNKAERTEVELTDLIFFKIGRLMNTEVKVENMLDL